MIEKESFHPLNYVKKEEYSGSMDGMRYMLKRLPAGDGEDKFRATVWPEPYGIFHTPEEEKTSADFPLTEEGMDEAADWLNEQYTGRQAYWRERAQAPWV